MKRTLPAFVLALLVSLPAWAGNLVVTPQSVVDEKSVFATIESANEVPARARIPGTITALKVRQGDKVKKGQVIGVVGDRKLGMQIKAQMAQVEAAQKQVSLAKLDLDRALKLRDQGFVTTARIDQLNTAYDVARRNYDSLSAQQSIALEQKSQGAVLAPTSGRVLSVPVMQGSVVMAGEALATIAEQDYVLRLSLPERHAGALKVGDPIHANEGDGTGTITLIYPKIEQGRLMADAKLSGIGDYFVGERIRVWVPAGTRDAIMIPAAYITTQMGMDYVSVLQNGTSHVVPVQRGAAMGSDVEILSGLKQGDTLVMP